MNQNSGSGTGKAIVAQAYVCQEDGNTENRDLDFWSDGALCLCLNWPANRNYISLFINAVKNKNFCSSELWLYVYIKLMVRSLETHIQIDPYLADVNVHPTTRSVYLQRTELMVLISQAAESAFERVYLTPGCSRKLAKPNSFAEQKSQRTTCFKGKLPYYDRESQDFKLRPEVSRSLSSTASTDEVIADCQVKKTWRTNKRRQLAERKDLWFAMNWTTQSWILPVQTGLW